MAKPRSRSASEANGFDAELGHLPRELRWREWMGRVEAAVFASAEPVPREALARLVGRDCVLGELIADIRLELEARPFELVEVAGGWHHRTRPRFAGAIRAAARIPERDQPPDLTKLEMLVLTAIAYRQPATRAGLSAALGRDISRDVLARLKRIGLIGAGPRIAEPGAPLSYVTTPRFLAAFGLATLRDLPDMEAAGEKDDPDGWDEGLPTIDAEDAGEGDFGALR